MKINIIIDTGDEQFEVMLTDDRPDIRSASGHVQVRGADLVRLWNRASLDADQWVARRRVDPLAGSGDGPQHVPQDK